MLLRMIVIAALLIYVENASAQTSSEEAAIHYTVWNYINGRNNGDSTTLSKAFHTDAVLKFIDQSGSLSVWTAVDYIKKMSTGQKQNCIGEIIEIKSFNNAAQATVVLKYPNVIFYDYLNLLKVGESWLITDKIFSKKPANKKVLFVVTSHSRLGETGKKSGVNLKEVSYVYKALSDAGYFIDVVSPKGGVEHIYGHDLHDSINVWFVQQKHAFNSLLNAKTPDKVDAEEYKAIYFAGGHGTMWDFPNNQQLNHLAKKIYESNGVIGALCHGPAALLNIQLQNKEYLVKGKRVSAYTDEEEKEINLDKVMPFLLESELKKRGAIIMPSPKHALHVQVDQRLVTGQNPNSAAAFAQAFLQELEKN